MYQVMLFDVDELQWDLCKESLVRFYDKNQNVSVEVSVDRLEEISDTGEDGFFWIDDRCRQLLQIGCAAAEDILQEHEEVWGD